MCHFESLYWHKFFLTTLYLCRYTTLSSH